jgi:hypothetical protein
MKEIRLMKEMVNTSEVPKSKALDSSLAALKIQKTWRGYNTRNKMKRRKLEEMLLIGMLQPSFTDVKARQRAEEVYYTCLIIYEYGWVLVISYLCNCRYLTQNP